MMLRDTVGGQLSPRSQTAVALNDTDTASESNITIKSEETSPALRGFGVSPAITIASGDQLQMNLTYEVA
jgi:hypothetical protein